MALPNVRQYPIELDTSVRGFANVIVAFEQFLSSLSSQLAKCDKENGWFLSNISSALGELKWCLGRPAFSQDSFITRIDELRRGIRTLAMIITILLE